MGSPSVVSEPYSPLSHLLPYLIHLFLSRSHLLPSLIHLCRSLSLSKGGTFPGP